MRMKTCVDGKVIKIVNRKKIPFDPESGAQGRLLKKSWSVDGSSTVD